MKTPIRHSLSILATGALMTLAATAHSEIVTNGSFQANTANGQCASGWTCSINNHFGEEPVSFWNAQDTGSNLAVSPDGGNVLAAWSIGAGDAISQNLTGLTVGTTYALTFSEADANRGATSYSGTMSWLASIDGTNLPTASNASIAIASGASATPWKTVTTSFVATASSEVLKFLAQSSVAVAPEPIMLLDGVSVTAAVPEPGTSALMLAGLVAVGGLVRRRTRAAR